MFSLVVTVNITVGDKKINMTEGNHVTHVPHLRSPSSEISETFGAGRDVRINLVVLSYVRDTNQS